jgi:hypothetical protein
VKKVSTSNSARVRRPRLFAAAVLATALSATAALSAELPSANTSERDKAAFNFRHLQVELVVAALSCGRTDLKADYNKFIGKFRRTLKTNAQRLKIYFARSYGARGTQEMDSYLTKVSNEMSLVSMKDATFCDRSGALFRSVLAVPTTQIEVFANRHFTEQVAVRGGS